MKKFLKGAIIILVIVLLFAAGSYFFLRYRYPLKYEDLVRKYSSEYVISEDFVLGVIWTESRFREDARSGAGAIGLMQIMPSTGEWIAGKVGIEGFTEEMLYDPETNIRLGCWYLSYLSKKFEGDEIKIMAGYNAGPGNVDKWTENGALDLEDIAFPETRKYVERVDDAKKIYRLLYNIH